MEDEHEQDAPGVLPDPGGENNNDVPATGDETSCNFRPEDTGQDTEDLPPADDADGTAGGSPDASTVDMDQAGTMTHDPGEHDYTDEEEKPPTPEPVTIPVHAPAPANGGDPDATTPRPRRHKFGRH